MIDTLKKFAKSSLAISIVLIIFALLLIFRPAQSLTFIVICLGVILAATGIYHMFSYFTSTKEMKAFSFELIEGIISLCIGLLLIAKPNLINEFLATLVGAWIIIQSVLRFQFSFNLKASDNKNWLLMLVLSVLTFILGIMIIFNPFATIAAVTTICGIMLLISEVINIIEAISLLKLK